MPDDFDPYFRWLGIPPEEQPPTLYRLLGLPDFEPDPAVIQRAAAQRMQSLRPYQDGARSQQATQLRNELSKAKVELLEPQRRAAYDHSLRQRNAPRPPACVAPPSAMPQPAATIACPQLPVPILPTAASATYDTAVARDTPAVAMEVVASSSPMSVADHYAQPAGPPRERQKPRSRGSLVAIVGVISGGPIGIAIGIYLAQSMGLNPFSPRPVVKPAEAPPEKRTIVITRPAPDRPRPNRPRGDE